MNSPPGPTPALLGALTSDLLRKLSCILQQCSGSNTQDFVASLGIAVVLLFIFFKSFQARNEQITRKIQLPFNKINFQLHRRKGWKMIFCKIFRVQKANETKFFYSRAFLGCYVGFVSCFMFLMFNIDGINSGILYQVSNTAKEQSSVRTRRTVTG